MLSQIYSFSNTFFESCSRLPIYSSFPFAFLLVQDPGTQNFGGVDTASHTFLILFFC